MMVLGREIRYPAGMQRLRPHSGSWSNLIQRVLVAAVLLVSGRPANAAPVADSLALPVVDRSDIRFSRLSTEDGLSQTRVTQIVQDDRGFLWFGTQYGLNRFDGYRFKVFVHNQGDRDSLEGVFISALFKDRDGKLWVGSSQNVDCMDPVTEKCTHYRLDTDIASEFTGRVFSICQDPEGIIWLATGTGLRRVNPVIGTVTRFRHDANDPESLGSDDVKSVGFDRKGTFWVATSVGLDAFDRKTEKVVARIALPEPLHMGFYEDRTGTFWIFHTSGSGLATYDRATHQLTTISLTQGSSSDGPPLTGVRSMLEDDQGRLWLGSFGAGLLRYDREDQRFIRYRNNPADPESIADNSIVALFKDREGNIWTGLHGNGPNHFSTRLARFEQFRSDPTNPKGLTGNFIDAIYEDHRGRLWIGTDDDLVQVDRQTGQYHHFLAGLGIKPTVDSIIEDKDGAIWVGTYRHGVGRLDEATGRFEVYRHSPGDPSSLSDDSVLHLFADHLGQIWVGTNDGLNRLDAAHHRFDVYKVSPQNRWSQCYIVIQEDQHGFLWLGTEYTGLHRFDPRTGTFNVYKSDPLKRGSLSDDTIGAICIDDQGAMWVGTRVGLDRFDPSTGQFSPCRDRGAELGRSIGCIFPDREGRLWMSTNRGLTEFNPATAEFRHYTEADGLPGNDFTGWETGCQGRNGRLYFGGFDGGFSFDPEKLADDPFVPPVVLTDFRLPYAPQGSRTASLLSKGIYPSGELTLAHDENSMYVEFAALSYFSPKTNRYRYKLEGLDPQWNEVSPYQRSATYTTLPAGSYVFRAQGATARGGWSKPGIVFLLEVLQPWWMTWWFRLLAAVVVICIVVGADRIRANQANRLRQMRDELARVARLTTMGELTVSIAHEVNQPLAAIVTNGQACLRWLNRDVPNLEEIRAAITHMVRDGLRGSEVVVRIRAMVRKEPSIHQELDMNAVVTEISEMVHMPDDGPTLQLDLAAELPHVMGDRVQLQQVLFNLMKNGAEAMPAGSTRERRLLVRTSAAVAGQVLVEVADTGVGVAPERIPQLFEPFHTTKANGLGMGLSICRSIIESHSGRLWAEGNPTGGMTFRFTLPTALGPST
jgi:ligand-binding sensor domain-containing protein/signal transduction histidine kinase